jgi:hypothetical protein
LKISEADFSLPELRFFRNPITIQPRLINAVLLEGVAIMTMTATAKMKSAANREYLHAITIEQLIDLCDDPKRNMPDSVEVRAILTFDEANGFFLSAQDDENVYSIRQPSGEPLKFRTIEQAIELLQDIPYLCSDVRLDIKGN